MAYGTCCEGQGTEEERDGLDRRVELGGSERAGRPAEGTKKWVIFKGKGKDETRVRRLFPLLCRRVREQCGFHYE